MLLLYLHCFSKYFETVFKKKLLHGTLCIYTEASAGGVLKTVFLNIDVLKLAT